MAPRGTCPLLCCCPPCSNLSPFMGLPSPKHVPLYFHSGITRGEGVPKGPFFLLCGVPVKPRALKPGPATRCSKWSILPAFLALHPTPRNPDIPGTSLFLHWIALGSEGQCLCRIYRKFCSPGTSHCIHQTIHCPSSVEWSTWKIYELDVASVHREAI